MFTERSTSPRLSILLRVRNKMLHTLSNCLENDFRNVREQLENVRS